MREFRTTGECVSDKIKDKKTVRVEMNSGIFRTMQRIALEHNTSVSEIIRVLVNEFIESETTQKEEALA